MDAQEAEALAALLTELQRIRSVLVELRDAVLELQDEVSDTDTVGGEGW